MGRLTLVEVPDGRERSRQGGRRLGGSTAPVYRLLAEAKRAAMSWIEREPDLWDESRDIGEWRGAVENAADMRAVMELFR
jgi:hypothetical protein